MSSSAVVLVPPTGTGRSRMHCCGWTLATRLAPLQSRLVMNVTIAQSYACMQLNVTLYHIMKASGQALVTFPLGRGGGGGGGGKKEKEGGSKGGKRGSKGGKRREVTVLIDNTLWVVNRNHCTNSVQVRRQGFPSVQSSPSESEWVG